MKMLVLVLFAKRDKEKKEEEKILNLEGHSGQGFSPDKSGGGIGHRRVKHAGQRFPHVETQ